MRRGVLWIGLASMLAFSCGRPVRQSGDAGGDVSGSPFAVNGAAEVGAPSRVLFDGFEPGSIASFWRPGDYGSGRYEPGAVTVSADYARTGSASARITVREGDIEQKGDSDQFTERAELDSGKHLLMDRDAWYRFSFLLPPDFPIIDNRLVIAQWKQSGLSGSPLVAQRLRSGRHSVTIRAAGSGRGAGRHFPLPDVTAGQWHDMIYHIRFSAGADGAVEVWMNGTRVVSYTGTTAFTDGENHIYNKIGLYRDRWEEPMTIYFDDYALGDSFAAISHSACGSRRW